MSNLNEQERIVLQMLRAGPVRNFEYGRHIPPVINYTARHSDLRKKDYVIKADKVKGVKGVWEYRLVEEKKGQLDLL